MNSEELRDLVSYYEKHPVLWDPRDQKYYDKYARANAWKDISQRLNKPIAELKTKITNLMGSFRREKSREKKSSTNSGQSDVYKSKWFAYDWFKFLNEKDHPRPGDLVEESKDSDSNSTTVESVTSEESMEESVKEVKKIQVSLLKKRRLSKQDDNEDEMFQKSLKLMNNRLNQNSTDSYFLFGQYIAQELRKYDARTLVHVKRAISDIIFEADLGIYTFQPSSRPRARIRRR